MRKSALVRSASQSEADLNTCATPSNMVEYRRVYTARESGWHFSMRRPRVPTPAPRGSASGSGQRVRKSCSSLGVAGVNGTIRAPAAGVKRIVFPTSIARYS
jgi:hypothetical protein